MGNLPALKVERILPRCVCVSSILISRLFAYDFLQGPEDRSQRISIRNLITPSLPPPDDQPHSSPSRADTASIDQYNGPLNLLEVDSHGLTLQDRQLMVHWSTSAYRSVSWNTSVEPIWQSVVPQETLRHPALKHGLLALSALHLAFTTRTGRESYLDMAHSHQGKAIISDLTTLDSPKYTLLSTTMTMCSFAFCRIGVPGGDTTAVGGLIQIFRHVRDSLGVPMDAIDGEGRAFGPLVSQEKVPPIPDTSQFAIQSLWKQNTVLSSRDPRHEKDIYDATIQHLSSAFKMFMTGSDGTIPASIWISRIHPRFMSLLEERQPFALVILAHFNVIIHSLRGQWWMGEWNSRVLQELGLVLDAEWRKSINWVMDATGCYIPTN